MAFFSHPFSGLVIIIKRGQVSFIGTTVNRNKGFTENGGAYTIRHGFNCSSYSLHMDDVEGDIGRVLVLVSHRNKI